MKTIFYAILILCSTVVESKTKFILTGVSYHVVQQSMLDKCASKCTDLNWLNYGIGINEYFTDKFYVNGGVYKNSYHKLSTYIGAGYEFSQYSGIKFGGVTGYYWAKVLPMLVPYMILPIERFNLVLLMPFSPGNIQLVAFEIQYEF